MKIEIYPECQKPGWLVVGAECFCLGEGFDKFVVTHIGKNAAVLESLGGRPQGWESFKKLYKTISDMKKGRRN